MKLSVAGIIAVAVIATLIDPFRVWTSLGDTDDATRLLQVRALLNGQNWFDLTIMQFGMNEPLISHWSRLVDAPLAVLLALAEMALPPRHADSVVRWFWPFVPLFALMWVVLSVVVRQSGVAGGLLAMVLIATSQIATFQFFPGRIDHHNLQILGVCSGALLLFNGMQGVRRHAVFAGALLGMAVAIGSEALPLAVAILVLALLVAVWDARQTAVARDAAVSCSLIVSVAFLVTVTPANWAVVACDALGANLVAFALVGAATTVVMNTEMVRQTFVGRLATAGVGAAIAVGCFGAIAPVCLGGPMAQIDPEIVPIWIDQITEAQSLFDLTASRLPLVIAYVTTVGLALWLLWQHWLTMRGSGVMFAFGVMVIAGIYGSIFVKLMPYAMWLSLPVIACAVARLGSAGQLPARTVRILAAGLLSHPIQMAFVGSIIAVLVAIGAMDQPRAVVAQAENCLVRDDLQKLAALPAGLVIGDIDLGPHIAAHTNHRVVSAPYHRMAHGIKTWHRISHMPPTAAVAEIKRLKVDYVVLCGTDTGQATDTAHQPQQTIRPASLPSAAFAEHLRQTGGISGLTAVNLGTMTGALRIWRVKQ
ncbi:MAG: hypothetical protein AAF732_17190 [Pseudomonadota bacterium]